MKRILVFVLVLGGFATLANAQPLPSAQPRVLVDHWELGADCVTSADAPFYKPSILTKKKLAKNEAIRGIPYSGCFEMDLPDRIGGKGFVKIAAGTLGVYNTETGELLRLAECNNTIYASIPFEPLKGAVGPMGPRGLRGEAGPEGPQGRPGRDGRAGKNGICSSKKCKWAVALTGAAIAGGAAYYYNYVYCPPGTVRRR